MQTNTAEIGNQSINFPDFSVDKKSYRSDPFTIRDGRFVGSDGFIVPKDFEEFYERFPHYVRNWVRKHADKSAPKEDVENWTQDLLIHLCHLPQTSKYRNAGKEDIVETFDPLKHYGANQARFQNYVNLCLANKFRTMHSKLMKDAVCRPGNVSFNEQMGADDLGSVDDEYCVAHSEELRTAAAASEKQARDAAFLQEFVSFVEREAPKILPVIEALLVTGTRGGAADWLGITESEFGRKRTRLSQLAKCFLSGDAVPRQRGSYQKRALIEFR